LVNAIKKELVEIKQNAQCVLRRKVFPIMPEFFKDPCQSGLKIVFSVGACRVRIDVLYQFMTSKFEKAGQWQKCA